MNEEYIFVTVPGSKIVHLGEITTNNQTTLCAAHLLSQSSYYGFEVEEEKRYLYKDEALISAALLHNGKIEDYPKETICAACVYKLYI